MKWRSTSGGWALAACAALPGCGAPAPSTSNSPTPPAIVEPADPPPAPSADYEVHEWGLIDVMEGGATEIGAGPGHPTSSMSVRKPVLYFHLPAGAAPLELDVSARLIGGTIYESFPVAPLPSPDTAHWMATLSPENCLTPLPAGGEVTGRELAPACGAPDGVCEVFDLPGYDASTASCVTVGGARSGMLFYRGVSAPTLPLRIERSADASTVSVTATAPMTGAPPMVLRVSTRLTGVWPAGTVVLSRAGLPEVGATVMLPIGTDRVDSGPGRTLIRAELLASLGALGLDPAEAEAFVNAWLFGLFSRGGASGRGSDRSPEVPQDAVIYFLPESAVAAIADVSITPAPRALRRAFMVRVILPPIPTS